MKVCVPLKSPLMKPERQGAFCLCGKSFERLNKTYMAYHNGATNYCKQSGKDNFLRRLLVPKDNLKRP